MRNCENCEYFEGRDWETGEPECSYHDGYMNCPFYLNMEEERQGSFCKIDMSQIDKIISENIEDQICNLIHERIESCVSEIIKREYESTIKEKTAQAISNMVEKQIADYMKGDITIGGGWMEPERTLPRDQYLGEIVGETIDEKLKKGSAIKNDITNIVQDHIRIFSEGLKRDINEGLKKTFDNATRQVLTENVVSMLMCNDTYKKLSDSMNNLLPEKETR